jgi:NAD(P)-dependent dehydrogenase (short-subunit alcohol dehydrogenase family)
MAKSVEREPRRGLSYDSAAHSSHARGSLWRHSQHVVGCWQNIFGSRGPALRRVKGPLIGLTKHAAAELWPFGVRVIAIAPARIEAPLILTASGHVNERQIQATPLGRLGKLEEVADLALYLTSDEASFITGQVRDVAVDLMLTWGELPLPGS